MDYLKYWIPVLVVALAYYGFYAGGDLVWIGLLSFPVLAVLDTIAVYGVRVLIPLGRVLKVPIIGRILAACEWWARDSFLRGTMMFDAAHFPPGHRHDAASPLLEPWVADGVEFLLSHTVTALREAGGTIDHVEATDSEGRFQRLRADAYVLAMGSLSPVVAQPLGISLPIYPAKGYSVTMPVKDASMAHQVSLTDDEYKLVFSRLGDRLRIAGTAELNGYDRDLNRVRCEAIVRRVEQLFPGAGHLDQAQFWSGLRPATPSNVPMIGKTKLRNLFLNTGHGTLGWTHACGSGKSVARILSGLKPEVEFAFQ